jgi:hypothetical protein
MIIVWRSGFLSFIGAQAKANTTAGNAAFWRNSFNQMFMAKQCLVLPMLPFCELLCYFHIVANVALSVKHPLIIVNGTKGPVPGVLRLRQITRPVRRSHAQFTMQYAEASPLVPDPLGERLSVSRWRTEHFERAGWLRFGFRRRAYRKFRGHVFYRGFAVAENGCDLAVGFALGKPQQCFRDTRG